MNWQVRCRMVSQTEHAISTNKICAWWNGNNFQKTAQLPKIRHACNTNRLPVLFLLFLLLLHLLLNRHHFQYLLRLFSHFLGAGTSLHKLHGIICHLSHQPTRPWRWLEVIVAAVQVLWWGMWAAWSKPEAIILLTSFLSMLLFGRLPFIVAVRPVLWCRVPGIGHVCSFRPTLLFIVLPWHRNIRWRFLREWDVWVGVRYQGIIGPIMSTIVYARGWVWVLGFTLEWAVGTGEVPGPQWFFSSRSRWDGTGVQGRVRGGSTSWSCEHRGDWWREGVVHKVSERWEIKLWASVPMSDGLSQPENGDCYLQRQGSMTRHY